MSTKAKAEKKEFTMVQVFALWKQVSKAGKEFLSGKTADGLKLTAFYNTKKKNPKEPDLRVYVQDDEGNLAKDPYISMWCNVSGNGNKYLTGKLGDKRVVGFIRKKDNEKAPYLSVYYSEDKEPVKQEPAKAETEVDGDLPF